MSDYPTNFKGIQESKISNTLSRNRFRYDTDVRRNTDFKIIIIKITNTLANNLHNINRCFQRID